MTPEIKERLEYLRGEIRAERISYGELAELQSLAQYIAPDDVELLEAAGVPEQVEERMWCGYCDALISGEKTERGMVVHHRCI